ncbi:transcription factor NF-E2 45 kDa subunit [Hippoglossus hippoglossus]|uniref:transcription factor NF-E2 45 kDa subunit n=1 Tax=Hippoglossus hippoglossus TaxID=8267 RepID=UPI00148D03C2|nr:transcription factor NF-E2 45 kDa subunit [Hippoglossus hippoglossus]XP_034445883.1 transcription factor NF-E2 45 kDa subunit [Hippoglossus hippoglossus]XP_034445884.1 transcription factor NF-E2 45 kDa subunit [Hippoglossus hippoglossus]XP_034445885.1 transcription factor NF-E2 45 kDa subunit [Hippoglossus hippoglossus]XP_034445886.1 transcription factor NF-E2 45 kDa subunit [Hippoglossus hippoglossus]XP_034445887.1 transcription factor NF-E2 45 kDa subunit [Hippoglossus hippoglossus]
MCSTANYVLPLRRTCETQAAPGRACGVPTPTNFPGARPHGPQDAEMDAAWQELMAISELQEFEVPAEGPYEITQYQSMEPMVPMGVYGMAPSHSERPPTCELSSADTYNRCYSEDVAAGHHQGGNTGAVYGQPAYQLNQRMHPISSQALPSLMALREQMNGSVDGQGHRRANACFSQGPSRHMQWTTHGQSSHIIPTDDLESDSGLSLGSSPPLASPDNPVSAVPGYQSGDTGITYRDGEPENARRAQLHYSVNYQGQSYLHSSAHQSNFSPQNTSSHTQPETATLRPLKHQSQAAALNDMYTESGVSSRGSSQFHMYTKPQGSSSTSAPLSRDERRAMSLKIPFPMEKIINLPVDDFNELLTQFTLTDNQMALVRDIRRRGKNKVAAQNCRKRKLESIIHLEQELNELQAQKEHLAQERLEFQHSLTFIKCRLTDLYSEVFTHLRDEDGQPYSIDEYSLQQTPDGKIYLVPHTTVPKRGQR